MGIGILSLVLVIAAYIVGRLEYDIANDRKKNLITIRFMHFCIFPLKIC